MDGTLAGDSSGLFEVSARVLKPVARTQRAPISAPELDKVRDILYHAAIPKHRECQMARYKDYGDPCACCGEVLTEDNAYRQGGGRPGVRSYCRPCSIENAKKPSTEISRRKAREKMRDYSKRLWGEFLDAYGRRCACCGQSNVKFLSIDHVNNDGYKDRGPSGKKRDRTSIILKARREGWPNNLQLLCYNCNFGKAVNGGVCPHKDVAD